MLSDGAILSAPVALRLPMLLCCGLHICTNFWPVELIAAVISQYWAFKAPLLITLGLSKKSPFGLYYLIQCLFLILLLPTHLEYFTTSTCLLSALNSTSLLLMTELCLLMHFLTVNPALGLGVKN